MISLNEADHQRYLSRRKQWLDEQSFRAESRREGRAEGHEEGRAEGLSEGLTKGIILGRIQSLESQLGIVPSTVSQIASRSTDELLRVEADLQAQLANRS